MTINEIRKALNTNLDDIENILNNVIKDYNNSYFDDDIFNLLEEKYFTKHYNFLEPYLSFYYFKQRQYHLSYYFSKKSLNSESKISIVYFLLSLFYLGYNHIAEDYIARNNIDYVFYEQYILKEDLLLLAFLCKKNIKIDCNSNIQDLVFLQWLVENKLDEVKKTSINIVSEFEKYINDIDDLLVLTRIYTLLGHYFDKKYYSKIDDDILYKNIEKCVYQDCYVDSKFNSIKYSTYFNSNKTFYNHNYISDDMKIISYSSKIGNNLTAISYKETTIIIDSGSEIDCDDNVDYLRFFNDNNISFDSIKLVIYTHAHLDHVGNANKLLTLLNNNVPIYITEDTKNLALFVQNIDFSLFENVNIGKVNYSYKLNDDLSFTLVPNGHILGSVAVSLKMFDKTLFVTGDYCLHDQYSVKGLDLNNLVENNIQYDYLITECTYGDRKYELEYNDNVSVFNDLISLLSKYNVKIFLPAFAIGRSQEILLQLKGQSISRIHVLGLAKEVCKYYNARTNIDFFAPGINSHLDDTDIDDIVSLNDVIIASSGMLAENSASYKCYFALLDSPYKVALVKTGYMEDKRNGGFLLDEWENSGKLLFDVSLSAHATYHELLTTIRLLNPKYVICVHGDGITNK